MKIKCRLQSVDFEENTLTFEVDETFWKKFSVRGGNQESTIDCPNLEIRDRTLVHLPKNKQSECKDE